MREIRVHGQSQRYVHTRVGVGGRMDTIQCAVVLAKLERFDWEVEQRKIIGKNYSDLLANLESSNKIKICTIKQGRTSVYAQYTIFVEDREQLQKRLSDKGIPTAVHYPIPLNEQEAYKHLCCPDCTPIAKQLAQQVMSLPMSAELNHDQQQQIVDVLVS